MPYQERDYRLLHRQEDLAHFRVVVKETDLDVGVKKERYNERIVLLVEKLVVKHRCLLEEYIARDQGFLKSLKPYKPDASAPALALTMAGAAAAAGVGPMAAVAGAFAEIVGLSLTRHSRDVIVENGGDIFLRTRIKRLIGIFAGNSPFSQHIGLIIKPEDTPLGICTSSGTVGHSLSMGCADAVVILSPSAPLADAAATAAGNLVHSPEDLQTAVDFALTLPGVSGALAILGDKLAVKGKVKIKPL